MRTFRSLTSFAAGAALILFASSAGAVNYTLVGKLTENRGRNTNVPMAGNTPCGSLTLFEGPFGGNFMTGFMLERGANTQPQASLTMSFDWEVDGKDLGCVKHAAGKILPATASGVGKAFTVPPQAFKLPLPPVRQPAHYMAGTDIPVQEVKFFAPAIQLATSVSVTAPPTVRAHHLATQLTAGNAAPFRKFKAGAYATQTGRVGPDFAWCPPPLADLGDATLPDVGVTGNPGCANLAGGGWPARITYNGSAGSFGGTMSLVTHGTSGVGSMALNIGAIAFNPLGVGESLPTGGGYANYHHINLAAGNVHPMATIGTKYIGPVLGNQKVITMIAPTVVGMWPAGDVYDFGFPFTTMTVVVRKQDLMGAMTTTITAKGWDCPGGMAGPGCADSTNVMGVVRNISLVAGAVGIARLPSPFGDSPTVSMAQMQMVLPEPGATLQLLAGVIGLLGVAAWRSRQAR